MRLSTVCSVLAACSTALATPLFKRETLNASNSSSIAWNTSNHSNATAGPDSEIGTKLKVFVTGGDVSLLPSNSSTFETEVLFNSSMALNVTQLYDVASQVNETLQDDTYHGVVIVSNSRSVESLGFFSTVVFETNKTVVVSEDATSAVQVAMDYESQYRGALTVAKNGGVIYSGLFAPVGPRSNGIPVGILSNDEVVWFFEAASPLLVAPDSALRTNYSFTETNITTSPVVPIVYDGDYSQDLVDSLSGSIDGLVVAVSGYATNSSSSTLASSDVPIVYAAASSDLAYVSTEDVPEGAIAAGYLSPVKAQLLVSIAVANQVTDPESISSLFP